MTLKGKPWRGDVKLRFHDFSCDPTDMSRVLGVEPTRAPRAGDPIIKPPLKGKPAVVVRVRKDTIWELSAPLSNATSLDGQVYALLTRLPANVATLKTVTPTWTTVLTIVYWLGVGAPPFWLEERTMKRIAELGAKLNLDLYGSMEDEWMASDNPSSDDIPGSP